MSNDLVNRQRGFRAMLGADRWTLLESLGNLRSHGPGSLLLRRGESGGFVLAISSGRAKVLATTANGSEVLLSLRGLGDLIGEMALTSGERIATVQAIDRCTVHRISGSVFKEFLADNNAQDLFADYLVSKLSETVPYQIQQTHFKPMQRLCRLLLEILVMADPDHRDPMRIPLSQESLANALGLARSTVAEQIASLRANGALGPGPRLVVADPRLLAEQAKVVMNL